MGKRRIVEDSESEFHSESMRSKQKKLGKENIDSPLPSKQLFAQEEGTKQRSSDSNGGVEGHGKQEQCGQLPHILGFHDGSGT
jgi:hypothetical protein